MSVDPLQTASHDTEPMEPTAQLTVSQAVQPAVPVQSVAKPTAHKRQRKRKNELATLIRQQVCMNK